MQVKIYKLQFKKVPIQEQLNSGGVQSNIVPSLNNQRIKWANIAGPKSVKNTCVLDYVFQSLVQPIWMDSV